MRRGYAIARGTGTQALTPVPLTLSSAIRIGTGLALMMGGVVQLEKRRRVTALVGVKPRRNVAQLLGVEFHSLG